MQPLDDYDPDGGTWEASPAAECLACRSVIGFVMILLIAIVTGCCS